MRAGNASGSIALLSFLHLTSLRLEWGKGGRISINQVAAEKTPDSLAGFPRRGQDRATDFGPEPNHWRMDTLQRAKGESDVQCVRVRASSDNSGRTAFRNCAYICEVSTAYEGRSVLVGA